MEDPEGGQGTMDWTPKLVTAKKRCESCCCHDSVFPVSTLAMIKFVTYSPAGKIMLSAVFFRNSNTFGSATVSLECQTGQVYWRSGPGRITVQKQQKHILSWAGERTKIRIWDPKWKKFWGRGIQFRPLTPPPIYSCAFSAQPAQSKSWILVVHRSNDPQAIYGCDRSINRLIKC